MLKKNEIAKKDYDSIIIFDQEIIKKLVIEDNIKLVHEICDIKEDTPIIYQQTIKKKLTQITVDDLRNGDKLKEIMDGKEDKTILKTKKAFYKTMKETADLDSGHEKLEYLKGKKDFSGLTIKEFPVSVFNEISREWYGVNLRELEENKVLKIGELKLKAAAEQKNPDYDPSHDMGEAVESGIRASLQDKDTQYTQIDLTEKIELGQSPKLQSYQSNTENKLQSTIIKEQQAQNLSLPFKSRKQRPELKRKIDELESNPSIIEEIKKQTQLQYSSNSPELADSNTKSFAPAPHTPNAKKQKIGERGN